MKYSKNVVNNVPNRLDVMRDDIWMWTWKHCSFSHKGEMENIFMLFVNLGFFLVCFGSLCISYNGSSHNQKSKCGSNATGISFGWWWMRTLEKKKSQIKIHLNTMSVWMEIYVNDGRDRQTSSEILAEWDKFHTKERANSRIKFDFCCRLNWKVCRLFLCHGPTRPRQQNQQKKKSNGIFSTMKCRQWFDSLEEKWKQK